jgi:hypothetical protein
MDYVPQSMRLNPGTLEKNKFSISILPMPNMGFGYVNNGFVLSDLIVGGSDVNPENMLSKLQDRNYINLRANIDYLSFSFRAKKSHYNFNITERVNFAFDYSKNFMTLLAKGTAADEFLNQSVSMEGTGFRFFHFREYGVGYARQHNEKLSFGGRMKLLQGLSNFRNQQTDISIRSNPDDLSITATSSIVLQTAGLGFALDSTQDFSPAYLTNFENLGLAIDLGSSYQITDKIRASVGINDLGFIRWKTDAARYSNNKAEFTFDGIDLERYLEEGEDYVEELQDSLQEIFGLKKTAEEYTTSIIAQMNLGGEYQMNKYFTGGLLIHGDYFNGTLYPSYTGLAKANLTSHVQMMASYSVLNRSYNNVGFGAAFNLGPIQLYVVTDNLLGISQIDYAKNLNVRFGMNVVTGYRKKMTKEERAEEKRERKLRRKDTDGDGFNDYEDECPTIAGKIKGCTDSDDDMVHDSADVCPTEFGFVELDGCPDDDQDGVRNSEDACPDQYGTINGCPDSDNDSVPDSEDACPNLAGTLNGCPDSDGDGVKDADDFCPEFPGSAEHAGCPDTDGDSVYDNDDRCPDEAGSAAYLGCTNKDSDMDKIPDVFDDCPFRSGPKENKGCPKTE